MTRQAAAVLALITLAPAAAGGHTQGRPEIGVWHRAGRRAYLSPDRLLRAVVVYVRPRGYGQAESRVEIRRAHGGLVARVSYVESSGNAGDTVVLAAWTPDSRFFVFSTTSSGGHHPWRSATSFYSRHRRRFYSLDLLTGGPITDPGFRVRAPATVLTRGWGSGAAPEEGDKVLTLDLRRLERRARRSDIDHGRRWSE